MAKGQDFFLTNLLNFRMISTLPKSYKARAEGMAPHSVVLLTSYMRMIIGS